MTDWEKLFTTNKTVRGLTHRTYALKSTMKRILSILWFEYANHRKGSPNGQQIYEMLKITSKVEMQIIKLEAQYTNSCRGGIRLAWPQSAQIGTGPVGRKRRWEVGQPAPPPDRLVPSSSGRHSDRSLWHYRCWLFIYRDTTLHASEQQQQKQLILEKGMKYSVFI